MWFSNPGHISLICISEHSLQDYHQHQSNSFADVVRIKIWETYFEIMMIKCRQKAKNETSDIICNLSGSGRDKKRNGMQDIIFIQ